MNNIGNTLFALFLEYMRSLYIIYNLPAFPTKHLTIYPRTPESNLNHLENIFIKRIILMTRSGCRKREKRQREYNHSFVSHQKTSSFYSLVSILSKRRTCLLYKRQNHASSLRVLFFCSFSLRSCFFSFFSLLYRGTGDGKTGHGCCFFPCSSPPILPRSHSRPSPLCIPSSFL